MNGICNSYFKQGAFVIQIIISHRLIVYLNKDLSLHSLSGTHKYCPYIHFNIPPTTVFDYEDIRKEPGFSKKRLYKLLGINNKIDIKSFTFAVLTKQ